MEDLIIDCDYLQGCGALMAQQQIKLSCTLIYARKTSSDNSVVGNLNLPKKRQKENVLKKSQKNNRNK